MAAEVEIDVQVLKSEIKKTYASVSQEPEKDFIFPTGRPWAEDLGYPAEFANVPETAVGASNHPLAAGPVSARVGSHTGEPTLMAEGDVGIEVHRAARICAAGHGGQVLLSLVTRDLLLAGTELRHLGEHRLKDLGEPL